MTSTILSVALSLAMSSTGGPFQGHSSGGWVLPPGPGHGWGFPNGNPDGYGWYDPGVYLPLGPDRTPDYYFLRDWAIPADQMFMPTYYNPYVMRGQRYLPYAGCGGCHPAGGAPIASAETPVHPYSGTIGSGPQIAIPRFSGRVQASPVNSGGTGLTP